MNTDKKELKSLYFRAIFAIPLDSVNDFTLKVPGPICWLPGIISLVPGIVPWCKMDCPCYKEVFSGCQRAVIWFMEYFLDNKEHLLGSKKYNLCAGYHYLVSMERFLVARECILVAR